MAVRILLTDDSVVDREIARRALAQLPTPPGPVELVCAGGWAEASRHLEAGIFDLLLLDFNLPGMNGLDILRELATRPHPPVIMMTGQDDVATAVETLRAGAHDYVPKSAAPGPTLCLTVERVLERVRLELEVAESRVRLAAYAAELEQKVAARTALVRAQAFEIEELFLKAEEASRVKSEIVANMSHELRTPLNVILGYAGLLEETLAPEANPDAHEMLGKVRSQGKRLQELVEALLALGRLHAGTEGIACSRFALDELVRELRREAALLGADRELAFDWDVALHPVPVQHDREKIRAIAYHLLNNAIKFTHTGRIAVSIAGTPVGGIVITVSDSGIGLAPEARQVIFDDFRQLDGSSTRRYEGLGLGLGIVRRYTELLGGSVELESASGQGTTITVQLPALARATDDPGPPPAAPDAPSSR